MAAIITSRLGWVQAVLTSGALSRPRTTAGRRWVVCAAASSRSRASSSAAGSRPPPAAAGGPEPAAAAGSGPLQQPQRRELVEKLTETARNIAWLDPPGGRAPEASRAQIEALEARLGYSFRNRYLLRLALVHSSAAPTTCNNILAWVGDAAMYTVMSEEVGAKLGYIPVGTLSEVRKTLIGRAMCERYANHLGLPQYLVLGKSVMVQHSGKVSANMAAEMFEAVMGAIFLDSDLEAVRRCYLTHFPLPDDPLVLLQPDGTGGIPTGASSKPAGDSPWE